MVTMVATEMGRIYTKRSLFEIFLVLCILLNVAHIAIDIVIEDFEFIISRCAKTDIISTIKSILHFICKQARDIEG